jgi:hypothetical protein
MRACLAAVLLCLCAVPSSAQTLWSRPYQPNQIAFEVVVPDAADDAAPLSGASFLTWTTSLSDNVELATELPFARYGARNSGARSSAAVGNPFIGLGFSSSTVPFLFQFGTRIPAAPSNNASLIGEAADMGRVPAFRSDELSFTGLLNWRTEMGRFSTLRFRTGLGYASYTSASMARDWRAHYDAQLWRETDRLITGLTLSGRALLTSPGTTQHHAVVSLMGNWNWVQPGLMVGTSLNDLVESGEFVPFGGLTLSVSYLRP